MEEKEARQLVADTGRTLLEKGLVARTWGNISCRLSDKSFAISPSGLGYEHMSADDVPIYNYALDTYAGTRKPSSEKKVHASAYKVFKDVNFVIHTHQTYATAVSLAGIDDLDMTAEEKELLGTVRVAPYGLPGTDKLRDNVENAMKAGSKVILMAHHGAVILGNDLADALNKAEVLENVCRRHVEKVISGYPVRLTSRKLAANIHPLGLYVGLVDDENVRCMAEMDGFNAQLDDIAQMLGHTLPAVPNSRFKIMKALKKSEAILVRGVGCIISAESPDDVEALSLLTAKACLAKRYTMALKVENELSAFDCGLMRTFYKVKYAKKKDE